MIKRNITCDRCGHPVDSEEKIRSIEVVHQCDINRTVDLCRSCIEELKTFLNIKKDL
jgi:hypothetical protein